MPSFGEMFVISGGKPIKYREFTVAMHDEFPVEKNRTVLFRFESIAAHWRQGVHIRASDHILLNGSEFPKDLVFWFDTAPKSFQFKVGPMTTHITLWNVWESGDGVVHSWHNGGAMIVEETSDGRRYRCNDGEPDDDFDDLIFSLSRN